MVTSHVWKQRRKRGADEQRDTTHDGEAWSPFGTYDEEEEGVVVQDFVDGLGSFITLLLWLAAVGVLFIVGGFIYLLVWWIW